MELVIDTVCSTGRDQDPEITAEEDREIAVVEEVMGGRHRDTARHRAVAEAAAMEAEAVVEAKRSHYLFAI